MRLLVTTLLLTAFLLYEGCIKPPEYNIVPEIEIMSVSPNLVGEQEDFRILFSFQDGDGDLGAENTSEIAVWVSTNRDSIELFGFDDISSRGNTTAISGEIEVTWQSYCRCDWELDHTYGVDKDTVRFFVQITDRAGNRSNIDSTELVLIECFPLWQVAREGEMCP